MRVNIPSLCIRGCKYSKKCHADKSTVVECECFEPTEEYKKFISELENILKESEEEKVNESKHLRNAARSRAGVSKRNISRVLH